jgi:phosphate transport system substrate-binding protein
VIPWRRRSIHALACLIGLTIIAGCAGTPTGERLRAGWRDRAAPRTTPRPNASVPLQGVLVAAPVRPVAQARVVEQTNGYVIDEDLPQYRPGSNLAGVVKSVGSSTLTTLLNLWSEEFRRIHPRVVVDVTGGGSSAAMRPFLAGTSDIAPMSRELTAAELAGFKQQWGYEPLRLTVALDAVAVYVNKNNPLRRLDLRQLDALYSIAPRRGGTPPRVWSDLGVTGPLAPKAISLHGPRRTHGIHSVFRAMVLQGENYRIEMQAEPVSSAIVQAPGSDEAAIAFASRFFDSQRTRQLELAEEPGQPAYAPTAANIASGSYPLSRRLYLYVNRGPDRRLEPQVAEFLLYVCSRQGQEVLAREGAISITRAIGDEECAGRLQDGAATAARAGSSG